MSASMVGGAAPPPRHYNSRPGMIHGSLRRRLGTGLLYLVVFEASLFGSGQMLHIGPVTAKMILFGLAQVYVLISLFSKDKITWQSVLLLSSAVCVVSLDVCLGLIHGAKSSFILEDTTPLLYFLMLPFFELTIRSEPRVRAVLRIVLASALIMCVGYAVVLGGLWSGFISPIELYRYVMTAGKSDFMYDGLSWRVFYKGSLYLGIGVVIFAFGKGRWNRIGLFVTFVFLILTVTRGFLIALFLVGVLYALVRPGPAVRKVAWALVLAICGLLALRATFNVIGERTVSDDVRLLTIKQVEETVTPLTFFLGHGFGIGVPERPEHMEIAYLEIFQKQGIVGLGWYAFLVVMLADRFRHAVKYGNDRLAYALFLSGMFVFFESLTNPFINNPIGMSAVLLSLAGLTALAEPSNRLREAAGE